MEKHSTLVCELFSHVPKTNYCSWGSNKERKRPDLTTVLRLGVEIDLFS
jgi:hypothetical protein